MKNKVLLSVFVLAIFVGAGIVSAETSADVSTRVKTYGLSDISARINVDDDSDDDSDKVVRVRARAGEEISRRQMSLESIMARIDSSTLSDAAKASLKASIQAQINALVSARTRIEGQADLARTRSEIKSSVDGSYRQFALTVPKAHLAATLDRMNSIVTIMTNMGTKMSTLITEAQTAGKDVTVMQTAMASFNVHMTEAKADYASAQTLMATVSTDVSTDGPFQTNKKILMEVRAKIASGSKHLKEARNELQTIRVALKDIGIDTSVSASVKAE